MTLDYCNKQTFLYYLSIMTNLTPVHLGRDGSRQALFLLQWHDVLIDNL